MINLEHLTIKNFRGFDSLEVDGFSKINLFVGKNNCGKTSILEAIFLLIGMSNPLLPSLINQFRGLKPTTTQPLKYLFHNLSTENKPSFNAKFSDESERWLNLDAKLQPNEFSTSISSITTSEIVGIDLNFSIETVDEPKKLRQSSITFANEVGTPKTSKDYTEKLSATFVADKNDVATLSRFSEITKKKEDALIVQSLQTFDNNIKGIQVLPDGVYFDLNGVNELLPSNVMGDGVRRYLNIITSVLEKKDAFICIDEIENGLHYSAYKLLWKSLLSFSEQNNVQLFITTHNIETLGSLKSVLEEKEFENMQDFAKVFTVAKTLKAGYQAYRYSFEGFQNAIECETEIRS